MKVKLILFQKNEHSLLRDWLLYHGDMFGMDSIHVINHEPDELTIDTINKLGVKHSSFNGLFEHKYRELTKVLKDYKNEADLLIPIDCDEFLCYRLPNNKFLVDKDLIMRELISLPENFKYKVSELRAYAPEDNYEDPLIEISTFNTYGKIHKSSKTFYPAQYFINTDQGNHQGKINIEKIYKQTNHKFSPNDRQWFATNLCYIHFHAMGYQHFKDKMIRGLKAYGDCKKGGHHYRHYAEKIIRINKDTKINTTTKDRMIRELWQSYIGPDNTNKKRTAPLFTDKIKELRKT